MISIIIIGRNESDNLKKCIQSVYNFMSANNCKDYELIYVDSDSTDNSIDIAKKNEVQQIIRLTKCFNAAIARNVGAEYAKNKILFFIDGDMRFKTTKMNTSLRLLNKRNIITGGLKEYILDKDGFVDKDYIRKYPSGLTGGLFAIYKESYNSIGGMDERMTKGQDYDFFIRAANEGYPLIKIEDTIFEHFTKSYNSKSRVKKSSLLNAKYRAYLLRKNLCSGTIWKLVSIEFFPIFFLIIAIILCGTFSISQILSLTIFIAGCLYKARKAPRLDVLKYQILKNIMFPIFFLFFFPLNKGYEVEIV